MNTNTLTDIERAALALLVNAGAQHPALQSWIQAMATNPDECRQLGNYTIDEAVTVELDGRTMTLAEYCRLRGYVTPGDTAIEDKEPRGKKPNSKLERDIARRDRIIYHLAIEVASYRATGRASHLSAALVEYHNAMVNAVLLENDLH